MKYLICSIFLIAMENDIIKYHRINTPDKNYFYVKVVSKNEADEIEKKYKNKSIDSGLLSVNNQVAYKIDGNKVLYRQFYEDVGFIFPKLEDYNRAIKGKNYWSTNIQLDSNGDFIVAFLLRPANVNSFFLNTDRELSEIKSFEEWKFLILKNKEIVMFRKRSATLSDGYWFNSMSDFTFFYHVLSGK